MVRERERKAEAAFVEELMEEAELNREARELLSLVKDMRRYQRQYFKERKKEYLIEAKRLEARVDEKLLELKI